MEIMDEKAGHAFRKAWIIGVRTHFPGVPKDGYVVPWEDMPQWERESAAAVFHQVRTFIEQTGKAALRLSLNQKSQYVALCWTAQVFKHFPSPKPSYVAEWSNLPEWHKSTNADIFLFIENYMQESRVE